MRERNVYREHKSEGIGGWNNRTIPLQGEFVQKTSIYPFGTRIEGEHLGSKPGTRNKL
jgi:hypothetical protein